MTRAKKMSLTELVEKAKQNDAAALEELYVRLLPMVLKRVGKKKPLFFQRS